MSFYPLLRATAETLLAEKGQEVTITTRTSGSYSTSTGTAAQTTATTTANAAVFDYPLKDVDGTRILRGDKRVLLSAEGLTVVPDTTDRVTIGGVVHHVIDVQVVAPAGDAVLYKLQVRRGA